MPELQLSEPMASEPRVSEPLQVERLLVRRGLQEHGKPLLALLLGLGVLDFLYSALVYPLLAGAPYPGAVMALPMGCCALWAGAMTGAERQMLSRFWLARPVGRLRISLLPLVGALGPVWGLGLGLAVVGWLLNISGDVPGLTALPALLLPLFAGLLGGVLVPDRASRLGVGVVLVMLGWFLPLLGEGISVQWMGQSPEPLSDGEVQCLVLLWTGHLALLWVYHQSRVLPLPMLQVRWTFVSSLLGGMVVFSLLAAVRA